MKDHGGDSERSIALYGAFNPAVISVDWLASVGLLPADAAVEMTVTAGVSGTAVKVAADSFAVEVTGATFLATATNGHRFDDLVRLVNEIFALLRHTPIDAAACSLEIAVSPTVATNLFGSLTPVERGSSLGPASARQVTFDFPPGPEGFDTRVQLTQADIAAGARISVIVSGAVKDSHVGASDALHLLGELIRVYAATADRVIDSLAGGGHG